MDAKQPALPSRIRACAERAVGDTAAPGQVQITQEGEMWLRPGARARDARRPLALRVVDRFEDGEGELAVRLLGLPLQRQHGPEVTAGEGLRYVAELPWAPHAPLRNRDREWRKLDDTRVEVATTVRGRRLAVELALDERPVCRGAMAPLPVSISPSPVRLTGDHPRKEHAMRYVMLIHQGDAPTPSDDDAWSQLSPDEQQQIGADYQAINETPGVTPGLWMQPPGMATTVRVQHGKTLTTDGPFVSVKEALGGYFILEADDLDAAIVVASRVPAARLGGAVEVRPVVDY